LAFGLIFSSDFNWGTIAMAIGDGLDFSNDFNSGLLAFCYWPFAFNSQPIEMVQVLLNS